jgi:hypothetical protein
MEAVEPISTVFRVRSATGGEVVTPDDYKKLHALCCAALGRMWSETDLIVGNEAVNDGLVEFVGTLATPCLTPEGREQLEAAVVGMKGVE